MIRNLLAIDETRPFKFEGVKIYVKKSFEMLERRTPRKNI